jgi:hypothetical protein
VELAIGDLISEEDRILVLMAQVLPLPLLNGRPVASLEGEKLLELEILWDEIGDKEIKSCRHVQIIRISATQNSDEIKLNEETVAWIAVQRAGKALDEATKSVDADKVDEAKGKLRHAIGALRRYKLDAKTADGVRVLEEFLHRIEHEGGLTPRSRKLSSYSSAYYSRPSSKKAWSGKAASTPKFSTSAPIEQQIEDDKNNPQPPPPSTT